MNEEEQKELDELLERAQNIISRITLEVKDRENYEHALKWLVDFKEWNRKGMERYLDRLYLESLDINTMEEEE